MSALTAPPKPSPNCPSNTVSVCPTILQLAEQFTPFEPEIPALWTLPARETNVKAVPEKLLAADPAKFHWPEEPFAVVKFPLKAISTVPEQN